MEKLIKLLNEYEGDTDNPTWTLSGANEPLYGGWTAYASAYLIPSKKYGFIERLVKNDKIDLENYKDKSELYTLKVVHGTDYYIDLLTNKVNSDFLLMILSIQDNSLEYLCSILK